ncbi:uncharacterized protein F5147DRAFT_714479 [Suillus discolor]|uniref:Zn(2)-C6 fungal-type domain-containing protein n=1 Tax=Suillus discolor TaxID=1912936 RepID=A0A9P7EYX6_9AGAM|nr:uncharacterized protein F5147DRAFT_714479 [Suillus discolor]KAG2097934.1 hypothetical protein F5147DRAFT_714479 [Suillus discolor]
MKCDFPDGASTCKRCATGGHPCIVEGRKPRTAPNKREYLLAQIRHKDQIIESLLKQLHNPYLATPLSVASYKAATSPSDSDNMNVVDWLDRLQRLTHVRQHRFWKQINVSVCFPGHFWNLMLRDVLANLTI